MTDEPRPTDSSQGTSKTAGNDVSDGVEALQEEDAVADIALESPVDESSQEAVEQSAAGDAANPESIADKEPAIAELETQVTTLKAQLDDRMGQYMRIAADFENYRRRTSKEREDQESQVRCNTISELLPVIDNFERARSQIKPQTESEMTIHKSYQSVYKQLVDCLKRLGVSVMRAEGQEFDPNLHEAVMREPTDQHPEGTVLEELVRGYMLGERVLRHAMVKVAAPPEPGSEVSSEPAEAS